MIYDHERDAEAERERSLPDWGGDDLFASVPRRRIGHTSRPRRLSGPATGAHAARRSEPVAAGVSAVDVLARAPAKGHRRVRRRVLASGRKPTAESPIGGAGEPGSRGESSAG